MRTFRQLVIGASNGDAITGMALRLDEALRQRGRTELYGHHIAPELLGRFARLSELPPSGPGDVLIYHSSYGEPEVTGALLERSESLVLVYHNLTPSQYFLSTEPAVAASLEWGRHELALLRDRVALAVAVSPFNAADLRRYGYGEVVDLPVGLDPMRLHTVAPDTAFDEQLSDRFPAGYVLWLSQLLPHKRVELMLAAMHLLRWVQYRELGLVVAGVARAEGYGRAVEAYARRLQLDRMWFTGRVTEAELATLFRRATMFVTTSAHEGLALPPLEAMSFAVPVIAPGVAALPDTVGDAGLVLPPDAGPVLFAEAMGLLCDDVGLRVELGGRGVRRARQLAEADPSSVFLGLLDRVVR